MNKLQLYITTCQNEFQTRVEINADDYVQSWVCDLRQVVSQVEYPNDSISIFYMVKYIDTGMFVIVLRTIPKSPGSHLAAWIFIPYSVRISDKDVMGIVNFITGKVEASEVSAQDIAQMREVFSHDYEEVVLFPEFPSSNGLAYAYRYYGPRTGTTLQALLGQFRYQPCYLNFAGVLLINQDITSNVAGTNLTSAPLEDMAVLLPPQQTEVNGYHPTLYGQVFDLPMYVPMSRNIDILWVKDNAADIKQTLYVVQSEMRAPALNPATPTPLPTRPSNSKTTSPTTEEDKPEDSPQETAIKESLIERTNTTERKKTYHFQIPAKSAAIGTVIEFEITTNSELADSPIDGYEATSDIQEGSGRSNHLFYKASGSLKDNWLSNSLFALGGAVVGALIMLACLGTGKHEDSSPANETVIAAVVDTTANTNQQDSPAQPVADKQQASANPQQNVAPAPQNTDRSLEAAIYYLDNNQIWNKAEMENFPDLQGLYDDMNKIDRHKLVEVWGKRLADSRTFTNIARHSRLSYKKTAKRTPFNTPAETTIRIQAYLNNIDP